MSTALFFGIYLLSTKLTEVQPQTDVNLNVSLRAAIGCLIFRYTYNSRSEFGTSVYGTMKYSVRWLRIQTSDFSMRVPLHVRAARIDIWVEFIKYVSCRGTSKRVSQKASIDHIVSITDNAHDKKMPRFTGPLRAHMDNMKEKLS